MIKQMAFILILCTAALFLTVDAVSEMASPDYRCTNSVFSSGGGAMSSPTFRADSTMGQSSPLMDSLYPPYSTAYSLYPGFWYTVDAPYVLGCWGDFGPADGDVDGTDLNELAQGFAVSYYDEIDLAVFAADFGRIDCF